MFEVLHVGKVKVNVCIRDEASLGSSRAGQFRNGRVSVHDPCRRSLQYQFNYSATVAIVMGIITAIIAYVVQLRGSREAL